MSPETVIAIQQALAPIAEKIGQGAAFGWEVVVRQQYFEGLSSLIWSLPVAIIALVLWFTSFKFAKDTDGASLWVIVPALVFTVFAFCLLDNGVLHLLNPSYYALQFFIDLVH